MAEPAQTTPRYSREEWDDMQALMRASFVEAVDGQDMRTTASGRLMIERYGDRIHG